MTRINSIFFMASPRWVIIDFHDVQSQFSSVQLSAFYFLKNVYSSCDWKAKNISQVINLQYFCMDTPEHRRLVHSCTHVTDGILPKGPYPPCLCMADKALLAGYPRLWYILQRMHIVLFCCVLLWFYHQFFVVWCDVCPLNFQGCFSGTGAIIRVSEVTLKNMGKRLFPNHN